MRVAGGVPMAEPLLRLTVGEKRFAGKLVLAGLDLEIAPGEILALVGPSGCGKSTSLMLANGLDEDFVGTRVPAPGLRIVPHFQEPALLPWRSLSGNVDMALPAAERGRGQARRWLDAVELPRDSHGQFPSQVSLGMQRRAALARTLAADGDLLLLDEPLVSLDAALADRLRILLLRRMVERHGLAMLLVTHDLTEAAMMADRIMILSGHPARMVACIHPPGPRGQRHGEQVAATIRHIQTAQSSTISPDDAAAAPHPSAPEKVSR